MSGQRGTQQCRTVSRTGETIYSCSCALDPTCVFCEDCFQNSAHKAHAYKSRVSTGGSACSCGDVVGWSSAPYCSKHDPAASNWETPQHWPLGPGGGTVSMREPVCLIDNGPDGRMSVQQGALKILEQIQQPVVVVAVVGLYRTGKSYLMNRLAGKHAGFALGGTIESKTKGIWMWCVPHPSKPGHTLVLLDTEGLGDVEKGDEKHDTWIFCLAVLLSSTLVYNSMGTIDNTALEKLQFVTELTEHIRVKSSEHNRNTELMRVFPSFMWTVRDFTLELELKGKRITADEYLENALRLKPVDASSPQGVEKHNKVRQNLRDFFAVRRCFVMERPASGKAMKRMEELKDSDLEPSFVQQAKDFCSYVHHSTQVKTMKGGRGLTGRMLGSLAETYVEAIRSGNMPCLESAVESLALIQNSRAVTEALDFYRAEMERRVQFPTETHEALSTIHTAAAKQAISIFINASFNDEEQKHQLQLMSSMDKEYVASCKKNVKVSRKECWSIIPRVFAALEAGLKDGSYMKSGGYGEFRRVLDRGAQLYRSEKRKGVMGEEVLTEYLEEKNVVGKSIRAADRSLTEAQKKMEENKVKQQEVEQQRRLLEQRTQIQQQALQDLKSSNEENIRQLEAKVERERVRSQAEMERVLQAKLKEQRELLEHGFKRHAEDMEDDIRKLKKEQKREQEKKPGFFQMSFPGMEQLEHVFMRHTEDDIRKQEKKAKLKTQDTRCKRSQSQSSAMCTDAEDHAMGSFFEVEVFVPKEYKVKENICTYRLKCQAPGLFKCKFTSLVFKMETAGEVQYHSVPWGDKLKDLPWKPAGPLYDIKCLHGTLVQLHLPHCEILSEGKGVFLRVAHITDDGLEIIKANTITESHMVMAVTKLSLFGAVTEYFFGRNIRALVLVLHQPSTQPALQVLLLSSNTDIHMVKQKREQLIHPRKEIYIDINPHCVVNTHKHYSLVTDPKTSVTPVTAEYVVDCGQNFQPTFTVYLNTLKELMLMLGDETKEVWKNLVTIAVDSTVVRGEAEQQSISRDFFKKHKGALEARLSILGPILIELEKMEVLNWAERDMIQSESTDANKNNRLLTFLEKKGAMAQYIFCQVLRDEDPLLFNSLEGSS